MSEPYLAEIRIFPYNFAPVGWAFCNGQILPISQNTALFSLVGTYYGGDGISTFGLPNLQGSVPMFWDQGPGLTSRSLGETGGESAVTLLQNQMPAHTHSLAATTAQSDDNTPSNNVFSRPSTSLYAPNGSPTVAMSTSALGQLGGNQPHNNLQPYLVLNFCIALQGIFPPRS